MTQLVRPTILLLKEGTDKSQGRGQIIHNINACQAVVDILKTTLGPRGMDKLIEQNNTVTISNDGATIIKTLDIVHPAAKTLTDIAMSQDEEVGDGTTTVVLLAGEFLKGAKQFIEEGVHSQTIIRGFRRACRIVLSKLQDLSIDLSKKTDKEKRDMMVKCAQTTLNSKLISQHKSYFAEMAVNAVMSLEVDMDMKNLGIKKVSGGSVTESLLVPGVAFKRTFSYAGFEQQPKRFENPAICMLNVELELMAEKENAEVRLKDPEEYQRIVDAEWQIIYDKLDKIRDSGAQVVLSRLPIGDLATQYFADHDVFCAGRVPEDDLNRTALATGGIVQTSLNDLEPALGSCGLFEERQVGAERYNFFTKCPYAKTCTIVLRGGSEQFIEESHRSLHDAIQVVKRCRQHNRIVGGAGSVEMELSRYLKNYSKQIKDKTQLIMNAYARAFECIPRYLCDNAGFDQTLNVLAQLRYEHHVNANKWCGVDIENETVCDAYKEFVWEPMLNKKNAISAATEAACLVLSVDETVRNPKSQNPQDNRKVPDPNRRPTGPVSIR